MDYDIDDFVKLYQLEGQWSMAYKDGELVETWEKLYDKKMKGQTVFIKGDDELSQEEITLFLKDGRIYYTPDVKDQNDGKPIPFTLTEMKKNTFIFENKEHDFPQRITYQLVPPDRLNASIEGNTPKGFRKIEYKFKRKTKETD